MPTELPLSHLLLAVATGIGLAAAVGFRVFAPLLLVGLAARFGHLDLAGGFTWLGSEAAIVMLAAAAAAEIAAYFIPYFDHLLDVASGPVAVAAGTLLMASTLIEMAPWLRWTIALIAGGGTAGLVHGATAGLRLGSTATTGGLANPVFAGLESGGAILLAILAVVVPLLALVLVVMLVFRTGRWLRRILPSFLLLIAATGGVPAPAPAAGAPDLVEFRLKDQFDKLWTVGSCRDRVVVVAVGDRKGTEFVQVWAPALRDSLADLIGRHRVTFLRVAHVKGAPFFIKGKIKGVFREKYPPTLLDFPGLFKAAYDLPDDLCAVLVFGRDGRLRLQRNVAGPDAGTRDEIITYVRTAVASRL